MRIVYISSSIIPSRFANSINVMKMCQAMAKIGHEVILIAPDIIDKYENNVSDIFAFYGVDRCFNMIKLPWLKIKGQTCLYGLNAALKAKSLKPDLVYSRSLIDCFFTAFLGLQLLFESHLPVEKKSNLQRWMFLNVLKSRSFRKLVVITLPQSITMK